MPPTEEARNIAVVRGYYAAIAHGATGLDWDRWFAPDVVQDEFPNQLLPAGTRRDLRAMQEAAQRGQAIIDHQEFEVIEMLASGDKVVVEAEWRGRIGQAAGPFKAGARLRTRFAQVLELRDGKIVALRNYDCFYPWE